MKQIQIIMFVLFSLLLTINILQAQSLKISPAELTLHLQKELKLTKQQVQKLQVIFEDMKEETSELQVTLKEKPEELEFALEEVLSNTRKKIQALLTDEQLKLFNTLNIFPNKQEMDNKQEK